MTFVFIILKGSVLSSIRDKSPILLLGVPSYGSWLLSTPNSKQYFAALSRSVSPHAKHLGGRHSGSTIHDLCPWPTFHHLEAID